MLIVSVGLSVHLLGTTNLSPAKQLNGWNAVWVGNLGGLKKPCITWGSDPSTKSGMFFFFGGGRKVECARAIVNYRKYVAEVCKTSCTDQVLLGGVEALKCGYGEEWKKISWVDKISSEEVLAKVEENRQMSSSRDITGLDIFEASEFTEGWKKGKPKAGKRRMQILHMLVMWHWSEKLKPDGDRVIEVSCQKPAV